MLFFKTKSDGGWTRLCLVFGITVVSYSAYITGIEGTQCFKNEAIGDREGNVYTCDGDKECCEENQEFTCCESAATQTWRDQAILWGGLAAVMLVIGLVCCYFFKDYNCCKDNVPISQKCCSCCRKSQDENELVPEPDARRPYRPTWASTSDSFSPDAMKTPPPFTFKSPTYKKY